MTKDLIFTDNNDIIAVERICTELGIRTAVWLGGQRALLTDDENIYLATLLTGSRLLRVVDVSTMLEIVEDKENI